MNNKSLRAIYARRLCLYKNTLCYKEQRVSFLSVCCVVVEVAFDKDNGCASVA